jgi:hypothetical protein
VDETQGRDVHPHEGTAGQEVLHDATEGPCKRSQQDEPDDEVEAVGPLGEKLRFGHSPAGLRSYARRSRRGRTTSSPRRTIPVPVIRALSDTPPPRSLPPRR